MRHLLPYPLLTLALLVMWLLLNQSLSVGHLLLGTVVAVLASGTMTALDPEAPRVRSWRPLPALAWLVLADILRSNVAVARIILLPGKHDRVSGFIRVPLETRNRYAQAILACMITATPGTLWVQFDRTRNVLLVHILDRIGEEAWRRRIKQRYEPLLMDMFE